MEHASYIAGDGVVAERPESPCRAGGNVSGRLAVAEREFATRGAAVGATWCRRTFRRHHQGAEAVSAQGEGRDVVEDETIAGDGSAISRLRAHLRN